MAFTVSGTELVMTSSPSYASELASIANINVIGTDNSVIDASYYTAIKLNGTLIVDRNLIINILNFTNAANDNLLLGIDDTDALGRAVNLVVLSNLSTAFQIGAFGVKIRNSSINAMNGGQLGYFSNGPLWDLDNATITSKETYNTGGIGVAIGSILENSTIVDFASITFFGSPASSSNFTLKGVTQWGAFIDSYTNEVLLSKFSSPRYTVQRSGKFVLTDCRITDWIACRFSPSSTYFTFRRTMATNAVGPNANAQTTRYIYSSAGDLLANTALDSSGSASEIVQWGKVDAGSLGANTNSETLANKMTPEMINTNTGTYTHISGEYKLPLKVIHVSYLGALDINTGITFDVSAEAYLSDYTLSPNLVNDESITETTKATVDAYTTLETPQKFYDYAKSYLVDNYAGETATIVARSGNEIDAGSYNVTIDATAASVFAFDGTTITIKASTYTGDMTTTGIITLANGATFVGTRTDANGTVAPPKVATVSGIVAGSRLQIYNLTTSTEVVNQIVSGTSYTATYEEGTGYSEGDSLRIRLVYVNGATAKLPYTTGAVVGASGWSVLAAQEDDTVYNTIALDGSTASEFTADYPNVQVDISDLDGETRVDRLYSWFVYTQSTEDGIANWFGGITAEDTANFKIVTSVLDLKIDNTAATGVTFVDGKRLYRDDDASPLVASTSGGGSITLFAGKVFTSVVSTASPVITGDIDDVPARVQSGLTAQGYTTARAAQIDNLSTTAELDSAESTIQAAIAALNDISASDVLTQATAALTTYDAPTKAELDSAASDLSTSINTVDTKVTDIKSKTDTLITYEPKTEAI